MSDELKKLGERFGLPLAEISLEKGPVWLEFSSEGPVLVVSPLEASLVPFEAWPRSRRVSGFLPMEGASVAVVNRWGFLSLLYDQEGSLYLLGDGPHSSLDRYSVASIFLHRELPALILYRDFFYQDSEESVPRHRLYSVGRGREHEEPALFSMYSPSEGWEINSLALARDGSLLVRAIRQEKGEISFSQAQGLDQEPLPAALANWLAAQEPRTLADASGSLRELLLAASEALSPREILICSVTAQGSPCIQPWALSSAPGPRDAKLLAFEDMEPVQAFVWQEEERAILLRESGDYLYLDTDGPRSRELPRLPHGYVWTGISLVPGPGALAMASWEEQDEWTVGAAGIIIIDLDD